MAYGIYAPWSLAEWAKWQSSIPTIHVGLLIAAAGSCFPLIGIISKYAKTNTFGKKEWGTLADAKKAGLVSNNADDSIIIGRMGNTILRFCGDEHTLWAGPSGSGKTAQLVATLLSLRARSVLILDPKGQLYKMTRDYRSTIGATFFLDPTELTSARFNPLCEVPVGTMREFAAVKNIAEILVDASGLKKSDPFWPISASELLAAVILFGVNVLPEDKKNLTFIRLMMFNLTPTLERMASCDIKECAMVAVSVLTMSGNTMQGIVATARASLNVFADPVVAEVTKTSDFRISDLVCGEYPVSMYLTVPQSDSARMMPLFRLILVQIFKAFLFNIYAMEDGRKKLRRLQFIAEEFPAAGKIPDFAQDIQVKREYGISCMLMCQELKNLEEVYGKANAILGNCKIVTCFATPDPDSMRYISTSVGPGVETDTSESKPGPKMFQSSKTTSKRRRPLLDPADVRMLDIKYAVLLITGIKPLRVKKVLWFETRTLLKLGVNLRKFPDTPLVQNAEILSMHTSSAKPEQEALSVVSVANDDEPELLKFIHGLEHFL